MLILHVWIGNSPSSVSPISDVSQKVAFVTAKVLKDVYFENVACTIHNKYLPILGNLKKKLTSNVPLFSTSSNEGHVKKKKLEK